MPRFYQVAFIFLIEGYNPDPSDDLSQTNYYNLHETASQRDQSWI